MSLEAVCFDLDDTLYDYHQYARAGLRRAADHLEGETGRQFFDELLSIYFIEDVTRGTFDELVDRHDLDPALIEDLVEAFHGAQSPLQPYPATEPVLERLGESYRLGLLTDGRAGAEKLRRLGIGTYFDARLVTPTIDASKHDPAVFERLLSTLSVPPANAVYVGDDPRVDFRCANELGMRTVRLRRGRYRTLEPETPKHRADREIQTLGSLPGILDSDRDTGEGSTN